MKLTTTFWSDEVHTFDKLLFINGNTKEIMFDTDLNDSVATYHFFEHLAHFVKSSPMLKTIYTDEFYQFAVTLNDEISHIKWFNLIIDDKTTISHDIAFETTLIKKNNLIIPLGQFPHWTKKKLPKYREFNLKARAYTYMANQVKNSLT